MAFPLLTLEHAGFHYHASRWIFRNVNVQVSSGEVFVILGRNGVGKSTLLNSIIGLLSLTEGKVILGDQDLRKLSAGERARHVAYLTQIEGSGISYTVAEYLLMGRAPYIGLFSSPSADDRARVMNVLQELGIEDLARAQIDKLSGGQRQQVGIGRALVQDAPLIVLDEPTSALDLANQAKVLLKLRQLRDDGYGVIFTTHNPDHALMLDAQVAVLGAPSDTVVTAEEETPQLLLGKAQEVLTSDLLSKTFDAPLSVFYSPEIDRKTVHITGLEEKPPTTLTLPS